MLLKKSHGLPGRRLHYGSRKIAIGPLLQQAAQQGAGQRDKGLRESGGKQQRQQRGDAVQIARLPSRSAQLMVDQPPHDEHHRQGCQAPHDAHRHQADRQSGSDRVDGFHRPPHQVCRSNPGPREQADAPGQAWDRGRLVGSGMTCRRHSGSQCGWGFKGRAADGCRRGCLPESLGYFTRT